MCVCVEVGSFFLLFREGLVEFEVWVPVQQKRGGRQQLVSDWEWLCVSMTQLRIN